MDIQEKEDQVQSVQVYCLSQGLHQKEEENKKIVNLFDEESFTFLVLYCTSN